jgi:hypothetical protein
MMKKYFFLVTFFSLFPVLGFSQFLDDLPYPQADRWAYFQQETTSLMRSQVEHDPNFLLFFSLSGRDQRFEYKNEYLYSLAGIPNMNDDFYKEKIKSRIDGNVLLGFQVKINKSLYIPALFHWGTTHSSIMLEEYEYEASYIGKGKNPMYVEEITEGFFLGTGVFINTDIIKGGIYMGWNFRETLGEIFTNTEGIYWKENRASPPGFRIALVPMLNTSGFAYVGKVLNNVLGYIGPGNNAVIFTESEADSKISALFSSLNTALDFTFNKFYFGPIPIQLQLKYLRGSFDAAAKNDTYGLKLGIIGSVFGLTLEGGYKRFFSVSGLFPSDYVNTGYFTGSLFQTMGKMIGVGFIYNYDKIYESRFTIAVSTNLPSFYLSGFFTFSYPKYDKNKFKSGFGFEGCNRFRIQL